MTKSAIAPNALPGQLPTEWNVDGVVAALRDLRVQSLEHRQRRDRPPRLPSRKALADIVEGLAAALFPNRLGQPGLSEAGVDAYVTQTLQTALRELASQVCLELTFDSVRPEEQAVQRERASAIVRDFAARLPALRTLLDGDLAAAYEGDPAARSVDEVLVCYPGMVAVIHHRIAHELHSLGVPLLARMIAELAHAATGIDIHPGASIGERFFIDHGTGVVVGETAIIGRHVRLYQAVTLGAKRFETDEHGALVKGHARHPIVEDDVVIYAGATLLGRITIGRGSVIGGNVWLTHSVPPDSTITQGQYQG
jgi:serine O-acetyltransferase